MSAPGFIKAIPILSFSLIRMKFLCYCKRSCYRGSRCNINLLKPRFQKSWLPVIFCLRQEYNFSDKSLKLWCYFPESAKKKKKAFMKLDPCYLSISQTILNNIVPSVSPKKNEKKRLWNFTFSETQIPLKCTSGCLGKEPNFNMHQPGI